MKFAKILLLILAIYLISHLSSVQALFEQRDFDPRALTTKELIDRQFSSENGAHIELEKLIKQYLPNPDSYEHIDSRYTRIEDQLTVFTDYSSVRENNERIVSDSIVIYHLNGRIINLMKVD